MLEGDLYAENHGKLLLYSKQSIGMGVQSIAQLKIREKLFLYRVQSIAVVVQSICTVLDSICENFGRS